MARIELDKPARETLARRVRTYLKDEAGVEIDPVDAQRLLDFLSETLGPHYYNQGLQDAETVLKDRVEAIADAIAGLARPVKR
ncbi:MAG: DUF2164 domain-containing protein [Caulobacteraceae bacterium]